MCITCNTYVRIIYIYMYMYKYIGMPLHWPSDEECVNMACITKIKNNMHWPSDEECVNMA
jgi:hypothetical protein